MDAVSRDALIIIIALQSLTMDGAQSVRMDTIYILATAVSLNAKVINALLLDGMDHVLSVLKGML